MNDRRHLTYDEPAPDVDLLTAEGDPIRLSELWKEQPLLLAFTRHFGCPQCKEMLDQLIEVRTEIEQSGLRIVVVTQGEPEQARLFATERAPGVLCLADPARRAYRAYGLGRASLWQIALAPAVLRGTLLARAHGNQAEMPPQGQDVRQMSGTFVIGVDGRVRLPYYYDTIADHAPAALLLRGVLGTRWDKPFTGPVG